MRIFLGAPGTGKSHGLKEAIRKALAAGNPRILLWDPRHEYELPRAKYSESVGELARQLLSGHPGPWIFRPSFDLKSCQLQFDGVCQCVLSAQQDPLAAPMIFGIEECSDVITTPGNPPARLRKLAVQSRHYGVTLIMVGQRPTFVDTTMRGSATMIRCGRLGYAGDCRTMADWLNVDPREIQTMPDRHGFLMEKGAVSRF